MVKVVTGVRIVFGLMFFVFGLNGFLQFIPQPPPEAGAFLGALFQTGYFFPFLKTVEIIVGATLLANFFVALSLTVIAPVVLNIVLFHLFLAPDPAGLGIALTLLSMNIFLAYGYRNAYKGVLRQKVAPSDAKTSLINAAPVAA